MKNSNATTVPVDFARDILATLSASSATGFETSDIDALLPQRGEVTASFGISRSFDDTKSAVSFAWPYQESVREVDVIALVRGNGVNIARIKEIHEELGRKMHDSGSLLFNFSKSSVLPKQTFSIIIFSAASDQI